MINKIAYILGSFPGGEPPFIINEIKGLIKEGLDILVFPVHKVNVGDREVDCSGIKAIYADPMFSPKIIMAHLYFIFRRPLEYFKLLIKNKEFAGKKVFWEGVYYARVIKSLKIKHIHAHFAWAATDMARIISQLTAIPFSLTAHQSDIHRLPKELGVKLDEAKFILTCTQGNKEYLGNTYQKGIGLKTFNVYHGIDVRGFIPLAEKRCRDIDILSIGNLIEVKGFRYLIEACASLKGCKLFKKCVIVGNGEERRNLESLIDRLGLKDNIAIQDPVSYSKITDFYQRAKIFALPVTVVNGAPHGIPNVLAEAMAMELTVVTTDVPHIPELIENGKDGILIPDKSPEKLAESIERLLSNEELRFRLGVNAREKITKDFDAQKHIRKIADFFARVV